MKRILLLSFYYTPDLSAGSFRMAALTNELKKYPNLQFDLITTMPNRYHHFSNEALTEEQDGNIHITRIQLPEHKNGFVDQAKTFLYYFKCARKLTNAKSYDLVFATSSRLFTAFLGSNIARKQHCPLFLDIRDIFTETMASVLKTPLKQLCMPLFYLAEKYTLKRVDKLNLVSQGFASYFEPKAPRQCKISYIPNGIDDCFYNKDFIKKSNGSLTRIVYAGNIGEGQGLEKIIPHLASTFHDTCEFVIIGSGGRLRALEQACENLTNVQLRLPIARDKLIEHYQQADILFLHLNNYTAFRRVLPSKIFEYAATGKPILAGVPGYSAEFMRKNIDGAFIFPPCGIEQATIQLQNILKNIQYHFERKEFLQEFRRTKLMKDLAEKITFAKKYPDIITKV